MALFLPEKEKGCSVQKVNEKCKIKGNVCLHLRHIDNLSICYSQKLVKGKQNKSKNMFQSPKGQSMKTHGKMGPAI